MRRNIFLLVIALFSLSLMGLANPQSTRVIRVGVYENAPKIYTETDGTVAGFWPDLIQYHCPERRLENYLGPWYMGRKPQAG